SAAGIFPERGKPASLHHGVSWQTQADDRIPFRGVPHLGCDRGHAGQHAGTTGRVMGTPAPLISVEHLAAADPRQTLVVDCRFALSDLARRYRDFMEGHLPGAVHASLDDDLSDLGQNAGGLGRHPLPDASGFARSLGRWGWHDGLTVVACDAGNGAMAAARLWWLMRWAGAAA